DWSSDVCSSDLCGGGFTYPDRPSEWAVHLQSRAWHRTADTAGACRPAGGPFKGRRENSVNRIAVVLFNLGGPDSPEAVRPFLYNLFNDPAIITLPWPLRSLLAQFLSRRRTPAALEIYSQMGDASPLLP